MNSKQPPRYARALILSSIFLLSVMMVIAGALGFGRSSDSGAGVTAASVSQAMNPVNVASGGSESGATAGLQGDGVGIDAPNLENHLRAAAPEIASTAPEVVPGEALTTASIDPASPTLFSVDPNFDAPAGVFHRLSIYTNQPARGVATVAASPAPPQMDGSTAGRPVIEHIWTGLGGHRLALGASFPVIAVIRGGDAAFKGWFQVVNGSITRSTPVTVEPGRVERVEFDVPSSSGADVYTWRLRTGNEGCDITGPIAAEQQFAMEAGAGGPFWITGGLSRTLERPENVLTVIPVAVMSGPDTAAPVMASAGAGVLHLGRPLSIVMPEQAPETSAGWAPARVIGVDPAVESALTPAAIAALRGWVVAGGSLVVAPGSVFLRSSEPVARIASSDYQMEGPSGLSKYTVHPVGLGAVIYQPAGRARLSTPASETAALMSLSASLASGPGAVGDAAARSMLSSASADTPTLSTPRWPVFVGMGLVYIVLFGPFSLWLMRRVHRILHVWLVVPGIALGCTVLILLAGHAFTNSLRTFNASEVVVAPSGYATALERVSQMFFTPDPGTYELAENNLLVQSCSNGVQNVPVQELTAAGPHKLKLQDLPGYSETTLTSEGVALLDGRLNITFHPDGSGSLSNRLGASIPAGMLRAGYYTRLVPALAPGGVYSFGRTGWQFNNTPPGTPSFPGVSAAVDVLMQRMDSSAFAPYDPTSARWIIPNAPPLEASLLSKPVSGIESRVLVVTARAPRLLLQLPKSERDRLKAQRLAQMRTQREAAREVDLNQARASLRILRQEIERIKAALQSRRAPGSPGGARGEGYDALDTAWMEHEILHLRDQCRPLEQRIKDDSRAAVSPPETRPGDTGARANPVR